MVGAEGFEPPTLCSQSRCATRLRYAPTLFFDCIAEPVVTRAVAAGGLDSMMQQPREGPDCQDDRNGKDHRHDEGEHHQE
jgi:hypothetical protein